jgi:hypothetical protein
MAKSGNDSLIRQHKRLAMGEHVTGMKKGGVVKKSEGGMACKKGGKVKKGK